MTLTPENCAEIKALVANDGHQFKTAKNELEYCCVCGGYEGGLPTHCPGKHMDSIQTDAVYQGKLDFRGGEWVGKPTVHMAHAYGFVP